VTTGLTNEQKDFVEALRSFCERECAPGKVDDLGERDDHHSESIARRMAELGWYGLTVPEEYGGSGGTFLDAAIFLEEYSRGRAPIGGYNVSLITAGALMRFGSQEQKAEHLRHFAEGGVLAIAMSEPEAGSDVGSLRSRARRDDGDWVLDGTKTWISYAHRASHTLIVVRSGEPGSGNKHEGLSMFMVPRDAEGLTITPIETLGGNEVNEMAMDGVRVPAEALVGDEGNGWRQLMAGLNVERVILGASALGLAQRAFDDALEYVKERKQFGKPIGSFQSQQHRFAQLATELLQARLLVRHVAELIEDDPGALAQEASMAKLACTELAKKAALEGMQAMGGYGYAVEYPMERYLRSAVVQTIFGGTSEIQKNIIARTLGL
jgi:alkylation response protein AidB-like acyl-CoA dehydrogenase